MTDFLNCLQHMHHMFSSVEEVCLLSAGYDRFSTKDAILSFVSL